MPGAGAMDRKVRFEKDGEEIGRNPFNEPIYSDPIVLEVWASRHDVSDSEKFEAGQTGSTLRSRFRIRSSPNTRKITPVFRMVHEDAQWNIQGVKETSEGRRRFLEITAIKDAD